MKPIIQFFHSSRRVVVVASVGLLAAPNCRAGLVNDIPILNAPSLHIMNISPEPSTYAIMALGLAGLGWLRLRNSPLKSATARVDVRHKDNYLFANRK
jgi:hypothetical protein